MKHISVVLFAIILLLYSCDKPVKHHIIGETQGTYYSIIYFDKNEKNLQADIENLLKEYDLSASNYEDSSIISKVNRGEQVDLDDIFIGNFTLAKRVSLETNGDFDITVRPLVQAWGFGSVEAHDMDSAIVDSIMQFVGYDKISLENNKLIKKDKRLKLDFDAIAQGYAVDEVCRFLVDKGISSFLVDIGGEIYASEVKGKKEDWTVGIEKPSDNSNYGEELTAVLKLSSRGMATSGNYRKFYIINGVKYAHTISPHTGFPISSKLLSATVFANTAAEADAYATSFMVMGLPKTKEFLEIHKELDAYLIFSSDNGDYYTYHTIGVDNMLVE